MIVSAIEGKSMPQKDVSRLLRVQPQKLASTYDTVQLNGSIGEKSARRLIADFLAH